MQKSTEKLRARIESMEFYESMPSVNVKIRARIKDIDEIAAKLPKSKYKAEAIARAKEVDEARPFFWEAIEMERDYCADVIFEGCRNCTPKYWEENAGAAIDQGKSTFFPYLDNLKSKAAKRARLAEWIKKDGEELAHVSELEQYRDRSGFYGRGGGHFCIGITRDTLEEKLYQIEEDGEGVESLTALLDAIDWGLAQVKEIAEGIPSSIEERVNDFLVDAMSELEADAKEKASPRYKVAQLRAWEATLSDQEREAVRRSIVSIEKTLEKK